MAAGPDVRPPVVSATPALLSWMRAVLSGDRSAWRERAANIPRLNLLLSGLFVWLSTLALPCWLAEARWPALAACLAALLSMLAAPFVARPQHGRMLGIWGFVGLSMLTWVLLGSGLDIANFDPMRGAIGAIAWALFAFAWGSVRLVDTVPEKDPRVLESERLVPRGRLQGHAPAAFVVTCIGAVLPAWVAWREAREEHALFAHGAALIAGLALLHVGSQLAARRDSWQPLGAPKLRLNVAIAPLSLAGALFILGLVLWLL